MNQIEDVCKDIEKTINQTIQNTLNHLERDCDEIGQQVDLAIATDNQARSHNLRAGGKGLVCYQEILNLSDILPHTFNISPSSTLHFSFCFKVLYAALRRDVADRADY